MKRILVTGGSGFIGSTFMRLQLAKYDDVRIINLDPLTNAGNLEKLAEIADDKRDSFYQADIVNAAATAVRCRRSISVIFCRSFPPSLPNRPASCPSRAVSEVL